MLSITLKESEVDLNLPGILEKMRGTRWILCIADNENKLIASIQVSKKGMPIRRGGTISPTQAELNNLLARWSHSNIGKKMSREEKSNLLKQFMAENYKRKTPIRIKKTVEMEIGTIKKEIEKSKEMMLNAKR